MLSWPSTCSTSPKPRPHLVEGRTQVRSGNPTPWPCPRGVISKKPPRLSFPLPSPRPPESKGRCSRLAFLWPRQDSMSLSLSSPIPRPGHGSTICPSFRPRPSIILKMARKVEWLTLLYWESGAESLCPGPLNLQLPGRLHRSSVFGQAQALKRRPGHVIPSHGHPQDLKTIISPYTLSHSSFYPVTVIP